MTTPRNQMEILDIKTGMSYLYNLVPASIPRVGETLTIMDDVDGGDTDLLDGKVVEVRWIFGNDSDDYTVTIVVEPQIAERP